MKKLFAMLLATVMCVGTLAACGSDAATGSSAADASVADSSAVDNESAQSDTANAENTSVEEKDMLLVGTNAAFPPFEYIGDDGQPDGFDVALIKAIAEKLDMEVDVQDMEFDSLVTAIGSKIDAAIAGMTITDERLEVVDFSEPYYDAVQYVIVLKGSEIKSAEDLKNKAIGVQLGTTGNIIADEIEGADVKSYNKGVDAVNDLMNGRVDCVIIDKNPAMVFTEKYADKLEAIDGAEFDFEVEQYAIALPKGSDLVEKVNQALTDLKADGTFDALVAQYIEEAE